IAADEQATQRVATLIFKLLVVLNTRPALVESGGIERSEKRHPKAGEVMRSKLKVSRYLNRRACRIATETVVVLPIDENMDSADGSGRMGLCRWPEQLTGITLELSSTSVRQASTNRFTDF